MTGDRVEADWESSIWIGRPPQEIWNYLVDVSNEIQWRDVVIDAQWISDPPHGVGSTGLHIVQGIGEWPWQVREWEEQRIMSWDVTGGRFKGGHGGYRVAPEDAGSRVTSHARLSRTVLMRILVPILKPRMSREIAAELEQLKAIMEA